jgi:hypothetical protein
MKWNEITNWMNERQLFFVCYRHIFIASQNVSKSTLKQLQLPPQKQKEFMHHYFNIIMYITFSFYNIHARYRYPDTTSSALNECCERAIVKILMTPSYVQHRDLHIFQHFFLFICLRFILKKRQRINHKNEIIKSI